MVFAGLGQRGATITIYLIVDLRCSSKNLSFMVDDLNKLLTKNELFSFLLRLLLEGTETACNFLETACNIATVNFMANLNQNSEFYGF